MYSASLTLTNVIVDSNVAGDNGGGGWGRLSLTNCVIHGNTAQDGDGGGIHNMYYSTNTSISDNHAGGAGGGVYNGTGGWNTLNTNVYSNSPDNYYDPADDPTGTNGNISVDPMYMDTTSTAPLDWDLHLDPTSPLVDAGDPSILDPDGSISDIGAYGGPDAALWDLDWDGFPLWWQPGAYDHATYPGEGWDCDDLDSAVYPGNGC
jgi:hypothetical protein